MSFILAQICGFTAWLMILLSYYRKNTNKILFIQILGIIFYLFNYLFLGAWAGLLVIFIELTRDYLYYKTDKDDYIFLGTIPFYILLFFIYKNEPTELIPVFASLIEGFTLTKKKNIIVPGAILVYFMWVTYDISVKAYSGVLTDGLVIISNIGIYHQIIKGYKKVDKFKAFTPLNMAPILEMAYEIDKKVYDKEMIWPLEYLKKLYKKDPDNFIFIKHKKELEGYINFVYVNKSEFNEIKRIRDFKVGYEDILLNSNGRGNYIVIDNILLKEHSQNKKSVEMFKKELLKFLRDNEYLDVIASSVNDFEAEVLIAAGFKKYKKVENGYLYIKED